VDAQLNVEPRMHRLHRPISAVWLLFCVTHVVTSSAAGFDCAKAASPVEHAICASPELSLLDGDLAAAYAAALGVVDDPSQLRTEQRAWLAKRDGCLKTTPVCDGAVQIYQNRIEQFRKVFAEEGAEAHKRGEAASALGEYKVADAWPSGQGERFAKMLPDDKPICIAVRKATEADGPLQSPVSCQNTAFYHSSALKRPDWSSVDGTRILSLAKTLERLFADSLHWTNYPSEKPEFLEGMAQRLRTHTLTAATTTVLLSGHNENATLRTAGDESSLILRYERWGCSESPNIVGPRVLFFIVAGPDFASLRLLDSGGESPDDLFIVNGQAYFSSLSERYVDSHWKDLKQPQPELHVLDLYNEKYFVQMCDLLYWDRKGAKKQ